MPIPNIRGCILIFDARARTFSKFQAFSRKHNYYDASKAADFKSENVYFTKRDRDEEIEWISENSACVL